MDKNKNGTEQGAVTKKPEYSDLMWEYANAKTPKEVRGVHRKLKKYYGESIPFFERYPHIPLGVSIVTLLLVIVDSVLEGMT